jgi:hypothetical protein
MVTPLLIALFLVGFIAAALLGTQTYFMGEQSKPIHDRNWRSAGFHRLASIFTGREIDYSQRASSYRAELSLQKVLN